MDNVSEKLIEILRAELTGTDDADISSLSKEELDRVYLLACKHNVFTMVGDYMFCHGFESDQILWDMANAQDKIKSMDKAMADVKKALTEARIPFLPLKGIQLRKLYPRPWMRLAGDIDILIHEEDKEALTTVMCDKLFYQYKHYENEDHFVTPDGVEFDVAAEIFGPAAIDQDGSIYKDLWEYAQPETEGSFQYVLTDSMNYVHDVIHMTRHLRSNGCGINHIIDLWVLNHSVCVGNDYIQSRKRLLKEKNIEKAEIELLKIAEKWFSGDNNNASPLLEEYILSGEANGSNINYAIIRLGKENKLHYYFTRIFVPYNELCLTFPTLKNKKWLIPYYEVSRWISRTKRGMLPIVKREFATIKRYKKQDAESILDLFEKMGIL